MHFGQTFQEIRENKGIKRSQLADELVTASMIGKFEREESRLSFDRVVHLLEKMMVSVDEFLYAVRGGAADFVFSREFVKFDENGTTGGHSADEIYAFAQHLKQMERDNPFDLSLKFGIILLELLAIEQRLEQAQTIVDQQRLKAYAKKQMQPIQDYLMKIETWGRMELSWFSFSLPYYEPQVRFSLMQEALKRVDNLHHLMPFAEPKLRLLASALNVVAYEKERTETCFYLQEMAAELKKHPSLSFEMRMKYEMGRHLIATGEVSRGQTMAQQVVQHLKMYDYEAFVYTWGDLEQILKDYMTFWQLAEDDPKRNQLKYVLVYGL
ncbi:MAG TPA: helix-turn-helix domain-containing protein [Lactobacillaceae bacterium]|jgi:Rgg/GadR/MutR family transcriptional activator